VEKEILKQIYNLAKEIASETSNERAGKHAMAILSLTKDLAEKLAAGPKARPNIDTQDAADSSVVRGAAQYNQPYKNESLKKMISEAIQKWAKKHGKKK